MDHNYVRQAGGGDGTVPKPGTSRHDRSSLSYTDSDYLEDSEVASDAATGPLSSGGPPSVIRNAVQDEEEEDDDDEIDDAGLLRSMLEDSEAYREDDDRSCWVCFAGVEDDPTAKWTHPCRCRGSTKWVHESCIQRWVDEKQKGNSSAQVECPQCGTTYIIKFPHSNFLVAILDMNDKLIQKVCPVGAEARNSV